MTQTEPGWYPDPQAAGVVRWYDGTTWTEHTAPRVADPTYSGRPPLGDGWPLLARAVQASLLLQVLVALASAVQARRLHSFLTRLTTDPTSADAAEADSIDRLTAVLGVMSLAGMGLTGVLFIIWLYRAHRSDAMDPGYLRHGSGWAIGGWFVPVLLLWRPYQMVQDVHRGAHRDHTDSGWVIFWWVAFLTSALGDRIAGSLVPSDEVSITELVPQLTTASTASMVAAGVDAAAAVVAVLLVRRVTAVVVAARPRLVTGR